MARMVSMVKCSGSKTCPITNCYHHTEHYICNVENTGKPCTTFDVCDATSKRVRCVTVKR